MKCKVCESELRLGTKRCPHCGTDVPPAGTNAAEVFKWNVQDFPKPKKKTEMSIDWNEGKIYNKQSGKVYSQSSNMWSEPEEVKNLFNFDKKNEEFQQVLDKQMDSIEAAVPEPVKAAEPMVFDLPSSMDMGLFEDLINDDVEIRREGSTITFEIDEPVTYIKPEAEEEPVLESADREPEKSTVEISSDGYMPLEDIFKKSEAKQSDISEEAAEVPAESKPAEDSSADAPAADADKAAERAKNRKSDEEVVFDGIKKLMAAEEKLKQDMERVTYLTPDEAEKAEKIEDDSNKLRFVAPTISFRSIEDEYEAYRAENKATAEQNKEVAIEINEPSGTKVTVKTQEIPAASTVDEDFKTQEVQLENLKQGPTNVQVSVEVASAAGNASVEVTRNHDGSTVVNIGETVPADEQEAAADEQPEITAEETAAVIEETVQEESSEDVAVTDIADLEEISSDMTENEEFWKNSDTSNTGVSRMTITDIFGPDARRIISGDDEEDDSCLEDSLILDIKPEDIAVTEEQSVAINTTAVDTAAIAAAAAVSEAAEEAASEENSEVEDVQTETQPAETEKPESIDEIYNNLEEAKKSGFGKGAKALIAILVLILLIEMSVIGVKLFAPDSQAALFIERVQNTVVSVFEGEDTDTDADLQDDAQQGSDMQQQTNPTQQPTDPANAAGQQSADPAGQQPADPAAQQPADTGAAA